MDLTAALTATARQLTAAGLPTDTDPARAPVPGALLTGQRLVPLTQDGSMRAECQLLLVVPASATGPALAALQQLLTTALRVIDPDGPIELDGYVETPRGNLPAWTIPLHLHITP